MLRDNLISNKDYALSKKIRVGDVLLLKAKSILDYQHMHQTYLSLFEIESHVNIPYHISLSLDHHVVMQTYKFGHQDIHSPKLIERGHRGEIDEHATTIRIEFTRTFIQTRVNTKELRVFYHQADIKTIGSFEVHGPTGWFQSMKHLRVKRSG